MKPIILDTNILLDIFVFEDVRADRLRNAVLNRQIKTYLNQTSVEELRDVISRPLFALEEGRQAEIMGQWQSLSQSIEDLKLEAAPWKCQDPDDQVFLDLAFTVRPSILISKDNAVLKLATRALKEGVWITADYNAFTL
jgi:putative PIN family toxin of toxin-antitoxin system